MLVTLAHPEAHWEAFQASFWLQRAHKRLNRTVIQALVRERLELAIEQALEYWVHPEDFEAGSRHVERWLARQLEVHGLELDRLRLVGLPRVPQVRHRDDLVPTYQEYWLEDIATQDGFQLSLDVVVRAWVPALVVGQGSVTLLDSLIKESAEQYFAQVDLEKCLAEVQNWQTQLADFRQNLGLTYRVVSALLLAAKTGVMREDPGIFSDCSWVTRRQLKSGPRAFQPGQRYGFLDPYQLFFMLRDRKRLERGFLSGRG